MVKENVWPSAGGLQHKHTWVMHKDEDPRRNSEWTSEWLRYTEGFGVDKSKFGDENFYYDSLFI